MNDDHINKIAAAYEQYSDATGFAKVANINEIADNSYSLSIPLYVKEEKNSDTDERVLKDIYNDWYSASNTMMANFKKLNNLLQGMEEHHD